jgi:adenylylsulfate kinase
VVAEGKSFPVTWHAGKVSYQERCDNLNQRGLVVWFTGLSGSGKSTIAVEVERILTSEGKTVYLLDGDNLRHGLNSDLGFSAEDRNENIRRVTEVAVLFKDAGIITLVSFISPFHRMRELAREKIGRDNFIEIYVKADLETCRKRDPKGLYLKAQSGMIEKFTGVTDVYEEPEKPDLIVDTALLSIAESTGKVLETIIKKGNW